MRVASRLCGLIAVCAALAGATDDPFNSPAQVRVLLFVRTDCPLTNRYAPELQRIAAEFEHRGVSFWLVYPDPAETQAHIETHIEQYHLPGKPLRDPTHALVRRARATVAPEAAVFDAKGRAVYVGRIDDRYIEFGKARAAPRVHDLESAIAAALAGKPAAQARTRAIGCFLADIQ
jgi:hypothetical protein